MKRVPRRPKARALGAVLSTALTVTFTLALGASFAALPGVARAADLNAINHAASIAAGVGAGTAAAPIGIGAVLQTLFGLAVVVALVFACAWIARRTGFAPAARGNVVRTVGGVSLGGKERVTVVEIGDTWLVLGAAPGNVRLLHTLPAGTGSASTSTGGPGGSGDDTGPHDMQPGTFGSRFRAALSAEAKKRFFLTSGGDK